MRLLAAREADEVGIVPLVDHLREFAHVGADREVGVINVAELVRVGMDVDEGLAPMVRRDERVTVGRRFPEACTDGEDQVRVTDALLELGVRAVAKLACIDPASVRDRVLATKRGGDGDSVPECEICEVMRSARAPVGATDDGNRIGRLLEELE
jgi:hypothetical protein